ncbi:MAG: hypothetical protein ABR566_18065, partial [Pyrinomonadaceae bacterium]
YLSIITTFLLLAAFSPVRAQSMSDYTFTPSSGTFLSLNGATVQRTVNDNLDEGYYPLAPIGFNFKYNDVVYTTVSASTNGWMSFGNLAATGILENTLTSGLSRPIAAPLWDDLAVNRTNGNYGHRHETGRGTNLHFHAVCADLLSNAEPGEDCFCFPPRRQR